MTDASVSLPLPAVRREHGFGSRCAEFLLVGGGTLLLFPLSWWLQHSVGVEASELAAGMLTFYAAYVINDPHFSVTYLLFYKDLKERALGSQFSRAQRWRYWMAGVFGPLLLVTWAAAALWLRSAEALGWMIQLMFLLVGWHYVKQGFGVLTVLSQRRGEALSRRERSVFLCHCFAAWAYAWANPAVPAGQYEEKGVLYWAVPRPAELEWLAALVLGASTLSLAGVLVAKWRRERRLLPLTPLLGFLITIWSWTIYSRIDPLVRYAIPALHSLQYLYFVWLMKGQQARAEEGPPVFGRSVNARLGLLTVSALGLGWLLFRGVPTFLDDVFVPHSRRPTGQGPLGATPFFAAFFVVVNIHHYLMDYVIWRRENPESRYLR
jgi:hypothetical protein